MWSKRWGGILFVLLAAGWGASASCGQEFSPEQLRRVVRRAVDKGSAGLEPPVAEIKDGDLKWKAGGLISLPGEEKNESAARVTLGLLFQIEGLRQSLPPKILRALEPSLRRMDKLVDEQVTILNDPKMSSKMKFEAVQALGEKAGVILGEGISAYAKSKKLGLRAETPANRYSMEITSNPPEATIYYMRPAEYTALKKPGGPPDDEHWILAPDKLTNLPPGNYLAYAEWPDKRKSKITLIVLGAGKGDKFVLKPAPEK